MVARIDPVSRFERIVEVVRNLVSTTNWDMTVDGFYLSTMLNSVALVEVTLPPPFFTEYTCERRCVLGIAMESLSTFLKCVPKDASLTISYDDTRDPDTLQMEFNHKGASSTFIMKLMNIQEDMMQIPDSPPEFQIRMPSAKFSEMCSVMSNFNDTLSMTTCVIPGFIQEDDADQAIPGQLQLYVDGQMGSNSTTLVESPDNNIVIVLSSTDIAFRADVSLNYLSKFAKGSTLSPTVTVNIDENAPIILAYELNPAGLFRGAIAPRTITGEPEEPPKKKRAKNDDDE